MSARRLKRLAALLVVASCAAVGLAGQSPDPFASWRPTQPTPGAKHLGSRTCARCHSEQAKGFFDTPMARAALAPADSEILARNSNLTFREGPFVYRVVRDGARTLYTVGDGKTTISEPILFCFGEGVSGQTFIFRHGGAYYEGRVSYFRGLQGLGITILHPRDVPKSLVEAVGRRMTDDDVKGCFSCHTTGSVVDGRFQTDKLELGIGCEGCHGAGERHVVAMEAKAFKEPRILDPGTLDSFDVTQDFCGSCHMSFDKVMQMPDQAGINNIRFQPYRMFKSAAHFLNDERLSCVACHDPHDHLRREPASYDSACLACHVATATDVKTPERSASPCPKGTANCVTCHMTKIELPEMHAKFTDHWIRR